MSGKVVGLVVLVLLILGGWWAVNNTTSQDSFQIGDGTLSGNLA